MKYLFLRLSLERSMDNHTKDCKKNPVYQFPLLVSGIWNDSPFKTPLIR